MDAELNIIKKSGLSDSQAKVYLALLRNGELSPTEMAEIAGEKRENCYNIAKRLEELDLIEKTKAKKTRYRVQNPSNLEIIAEARRKTMQKNEQFVKNNMSALLDVFYANNYAPGSRTVEGIDGIREGFLDTLRVGKDVYLIRTPADQQIGNDDETTSILKKYRDQVVEKGMHTYALTPDNKTSRKHFFEGIDEKRNFHRTFMPADAYTAPVEIRIYGNKVAIVQYGEQPMNTMIESPLIADAMRQIHHVMTEYFKQSYPQGEDVKKIKL